MPPFSGQRCHEEEGGIYPAPTAVFGSVEAQFARGLDPPTEQREIYPETAYRPIFLDFLKFRI
jgi:hypothetical protein